MIEREIVFGEGVCSVDAVQRAAYRFSDRIALEITSAADGIACRATLLSVDADDCERIIFDFRNEVLDQVLRERIREETQDVRNLILALAFSNTNLTGDATAEPDIGDDVRTP